MIAISTSDRESIQRQQTAHGKGTGSMAKIIAIANQKGGVGKSTTAAALAAGLSMAGKKVLAIDMDAQANLTNTSAVVDPQVTSLQLLTKEAGAAEAIVTTKHYDLIPASTMLTGADARIIETGKEYRLKKALEAVAAQYDYIILDTPPALGILTVNALTACDSVIIPAQADMYSLLGISQLDATMQPVREFTNPNLRVEGILLTRFNGRTSLSKEVIKMAHTVAEQLGTRVFHTTIREATVVKEAQMWQESLYDYAPKANVTADYQALVDEIMGGDQ